jgi:hypothetical protein
LCVQADDSGSQNGDEARTSKKWHVVFLPLTCLRAT